MGEEIIFLHLESLHSGRVEWCNRDQELGHPFDIVVTNEAERRLYVEVKTSAENLAKNPLAFISPQELAFANEKGEDFILFRVYGPMLPEVELCKVGIM